MIVPFLVSSDSYKDSHGPMYNPAMQAAHYYIEARQPQKFDAAKIDPDHALEWMRMCETFTRPLFGTVVFMGLQSYIKDYLEKRAKDVRPNDIEFMDELSRNHGTPFYKDVWSDINFSKLPIQIDAVPEGSVVPVGVPLATFQSTSANKKWLPSWLETQTLRGIWYPTTVATTAWQVRQVARYFLEETCDKETAAIALKYMLHDFGGRGVSSGESAQLGSPGHLALFDGTDTKEGIFRAICDYDLQWRDPTECPKSVPAAEHSTIMSWGKAREVECYTHIINLYKNWPILSIVSDTWDLWNAIQNIWCGVLYETLKNSKTKIVIRLDSGDPCSTILRALDMLGAKFGYTINSKGYKELPKNLGLLQGDGVNLYSIFNILSAMKKAGWAASNIVFGMGGALLQRCDRDTFHWAEKMSAMMENHKWIGVRKEVVTDTTKQSKAGRFIIGDDWSVIPYYGENFRAIDQHNKLQIVWRDGVYHRTQTFKEVKALARA